MKHIYGVVCHKDSKVLNEMIKLSGEENIILHVDKKSKLEEFEKYKVKYASQVQIRWGEVSQIEAMINILLKAKDMEFDYISIVSGDCMPIKKESDIIKFLSSNRGKEFIGIDKEMSSHEVYQRVRYSYPSWIFDKEAISGEKNTFKKMKKKLQFKYKIFKKNKYFENLPTLYKGSNWFTITKECVEYICEYIENNPLYLRSFENTFCCDEVFFQTIVMNSKFKKNIYKLDSEASDSEMSLRYIDWKTGPEYPKILSELDFNKMKNTECIIGRKFNEQIDLYNFEKFFFE